MREQIQRSTSKTSHVTFPQKCGNKINLQKKKSHVTFPQKCGNKINFQKKKVTKKITSRSRRNAGTKLTFKKKITQKVMSRSHKNAGTELT
jgi:hypothetical protein